MGTGQLGTVYKVQKRGDPTGTLYAAKKMFFKPNEKRQEKYYETLPKGDADRYREIYAMNKTMSVNKLKSGVCKYLIREKMILEGLPPHKNVVKLI